MAGLFEDVFKGGTQVLGIGDQINRIQDVGESARTGMTELGQQAQEGTRFTPFGVTAGGIGGVDASGTGDLTFSLSPEQQAQADARYAQSGQFYDRASGGINALTDQRYQEMQAAMNPARQREQLALESRLAAQGRLGAGGAAYGGGNPEMFGLAQANREADMQAYQNAYGFAQSQQLQDANLGGMFQSAGFAPTQQVANLLNPAIQVANLGQTGQIAGQNLATQAGVTGLEAQINSEMIANDLYGSLFNQGAYLAGNIGSAVDDAGGLSDFITGKIKEWF